eukprot:comp6501_c0_seq1/m.2274 comp6501_c0_seq1/g.2274  ORF comp6501_c0_seq1/g.2274 comp6501_c0_seq1/m.2274 type:complete len:153 (-) comp6501_c0_seq1:17-475(-)
MSCCSRAAVSSRIHEQVTTTLTRIGKCLPGTATVCVLDTSGKLLYPPINKLPPSSVWREEDSITTVISLKKRALEFGKVVGMQAVPSVHLKGSTYMFSIYDVGTNYHIAICSEASSDAIHEVDTVLIDREVTAIIDELQTLMQSLLPKRPPR